MISPIRMNSIADPHSFFESIIIPSSLRDMDELYTEAVFADGKSKIKPIEEAFKKAKEELEKEVAAHTKEKPFNPEAYWRHQVWKEVENSVQKVFNFRVVSINPFIEKYLSEENMFESKQLNAMVWSNDRFPIDGIVTDNGFYDGTKSCQMEIFVSLGLIRALTEAEITAVFLHEFGHGIDPALVDIKYAEANVLSKYLTDRKKEVKQGEKKALEGKGSKFSFLRSVFYLNGENDGNKFKNFINSVIEKIEAKKPKGSIIWPWDSHNTKLKKIEKQLLSDKSRFTRQDFTEAYADNFARMYGYGVPLITALKKMSKDTVEWKTRRIKNEKARQREIAKLIIASLKDEHRTSITRALALEREMKADIQDPKTPPRVKKQLEEDLKELEAVIKAYQTDFSDFQNQCHKLIIDDFRSKESAAEQPKEEPKKEEPKESPKKEEKK